MAIRTPVKLFIVIFFAAITLVSCSIFGTEESNFMSAKEVCKSKLPSEAIAPTERIMDATEFSRIKAGASETYSMKGYVDELLMSNASVLEDDSEEPGFYTFRDFCYLRYEERVGEPGRGLNVSFTWRSTWPDANWVSKRAGSVYSAGIFSYVEESVSRGTRFSYGSVFFSCPIDDAPLGRDVVMGYINLIDDREVQGENTLEDLMEVLNFSSLAVAEELGCLEESALIESAPARVDRD